MSSSDIREIDKNFAAHVMNNKVHKLLYRNIMTEPFRIYGLPGIYTENAYCRLPKLIREKFSENISNLSWRTSGGLVKFRTDSRIVSLRAELLDSVIMVNMPSTGSSGFDFYKGRGNKMAFVKNVKPEYPEKTICEGQIEGLDGKIYEWTIYFPLYNGIKSVDIGLEQEARLEAPSPFTIARPVVFYGSSITQGGCASRPGNAYTHILCRWLDANMLNLGFSGNAKGEYEMAQYIASLDMSVFVMDYDHNAPDVGHLEKTHSLFFNTIRHTKPDLPVIFVSKPDFDSNPNENKKRREIIRATFESAINAGDKQVLFIDGQKLFGKNDRDSCTVDCCHPNDLGFMRMAKVIYPFLKKALNS